MIRTLLLVLAPLLPAVLVATYAAIDVSVRDARDALSDRARQTVALLAGGAAEAVWNLDRAGVGVLLAPMAGDPAFIGARVLLADGRLLVALGTPFAPAVDVIVESQPLVRAAAGPDGADERIGTLELALTTAHGEAVARSRARAIGLIGFGVSLVVCGVLAYIIREVTAPIRSVTASLTALAAGRTDVAIPVAPHPDEIGRMVAALAVLKEHAAERLRFIERQSGQMEEIERRVAERTRELRAALDTLRQAQDELVRAERLAGLGGMVATIAHEINTPLGNGLTVATTLVERIDAFTRTLDGRELRRSALREHSQSLATAGRLLTANLLRAADLISRFKRVAVDQTSEQRRAFTLDELCAEVAAMVQPAHKRSGVTFALEPAAGVTMDSYPGALGQVLTNLMTNAVLHGFDAAAAGGERAAAVLRIATEPPDEDGRVTLIVEDNGAGIAPAVLPRIFDPFFTTRLGSGGSGLGLHIVYAIVTSVLGGTIAVTSTPGVGTRFTMRLPVTAPLHGAGPDGGDGDDDGWSAAAVSVRRPVQPA
ncbi:sensor histidine kinase [Azospirillum halopraeferens]|uniref:sensor histidine kinase n=1 Tax=Azospirillum halopraeferens TaxID=34010 RepID=UPI000A063FC1|nr:ATP-binding protein [Azospirillum halopraeferens]